MLIAQLDADDIIIGLGEATDLFPDSSFPATGPDQEWMTLNNVVFVYDFPPYNTVTQAPQPADTPYVLVVNGVKAVFMYVITPLTQEQIDEQLQIVVHNLSLQRNGLINRSNWTQLHDSGLSPEEVATWAAWRLAVRQTLEDFRDSDRQVVPIFPNPPQNLDDYELRALSRGNIQTPGSGAPTSPIPAPAPAPAPTPAPPPPEGPLSTTSGAI